MNLFAALHLDDTIRVTCLRAGFSPATPRLRRMGNLASKHKAPPIP